MPVLWVVAWAAVFEDAGALDVFADSVAFWAGSRGAGCAGNDWKGVGVGEELSPR